MKDMVYNFYGKRFWHDSNRKYWKYDNTVHHPKVNLAVDWRKEKVKEREQGNVGRQQQVASSSRFDSPPRNMQQTRAYPCIQWRSHEGRNKVDFITMRHLDPSQKL